MGLIKVRLPNQQHCPALALHRLPRKLIRALPYKGPRGQGHAIQPAVPALAGFMGFEDPFSPAAVNGERVAVDMAQHQGSEYFVMTSAGRKGIGDVEAFEALFLGQQDRVGARTLIAVRHQQGIEAGLADGERWGRGLIAPQVACERA